MRAKEKAEELVNKYGKDVAINVVDELIEAFDYQIADYGEDYPTTHKYWKEVNTNL